MTNEQVAYTTWICRIKDWFMSQMRWSGILQVLITLLRMVCDSVRKTYELLISGIFCLVSSDRSWLWVTEAPKSKTTDKGETTVVTDFRQFPLLLFAVCFASFPLLLTFQLSPRLLELLILQFLCLQYCLSITGGAVHHHPRGLPKVQTSLCHFFSQNLLKPFLSCM